MSHEVSLKLDDLGISKQQSARWQLEAKLPDHAFDRYLRSVRTSGAGRDHGTHCLTSRWLAAESKADSTLRLGDPELGQRTVRRISESQFAIEGAA
jgi:hypothetical protein